MGAHLPRPRGPVDGALDRPDGRPRGHASVETTEICLAYRVTNTRTAKTKMRGKRRRRKPASQPKGEGWRADWDKSGHWTICVFILRMNIGS